MELGRAGAVVYVTGRTTRNRISEVGRSMETIEETAELLTSAGGTGIAVPTDHLKPDEVRSLVGRIDREQGCLDILVNDVWGGEHLVDFGPKIWESDLDRGLRVLRLGVESHVITSAIALPLLVRRPGGLVIEVTDGTTESNAEYRGEFYYDLAKCAPNRMAYALGEELKEQGCTAVSLTPGFLRSEQMLELFGVREENWRDGIAQDPHFAISESPAYVARAAVALAADPEVSRFNGQSLSSGYLAREVYGITDTDGSQPDSWNYIRAAALEGHDVDVVDYR